MNFFQITHVVRFTIVQAICSTILALLIGLPASFFCGRRKFFGRKFLLSLSVVPFCIPPLIIALGYVTFLGLNGGLNHFLMFVFGLKKPPVQILYSFFGLVLAHGFYNFPLIMKNVCDTWENLPSGAAETARLLGAKEIRVFRTVTIYQLLPSIVSSSMLVFIYCFLSFILVLLFGGVGISTLEVEIYKAARASLNFNKVAILATIETIILCIIIVLYSFVEQKSLRLKELNVYYMNEKKSISGMLEFLTFTVLVLIIFLFFIFPLAGIVFNAFTSSKTANAFNLSSFSTIFRMKSFLPSVKSSVLVGLCTGTLCTIFGFVYVAILKFIEIKTEKFRILLKIIPMLPMTVSSVVVGVVITMIVRRGNPFWLIFAQAILTLPLSFRVIYPYIEKIPFNTMDSAILISKNKIDIVFRVMIPICAKGLVSAFGFSFAVSVGDATLPLVLAIPKFDTLSLFCYRLAGAYRFNEACAAGLILGFLCVFIFTFSNINFKKKKSGDIICIL